MNRFLVFGLLFLLYASMGNCSVTAGDSLKIRSFVVKNCIILTKSKPHLHEVDSICAKFGLYKDFSSHYSSFLDTLMNSLAFATSVYSGYLDEYVQGVGENELELGVTTFESFLTDSSQMHIGDINRRFIKEFNLARFAKEDFASGKITEAELEKRIFMIKYYDDQNMGSQNYVISTFNFIFHRNPTTYELQEGEKFINGIYGVLFFKTGNSKKDYLDALFSSDEYRESKIKYWFRRLLNRDPTLSEQIDFLGFSNGNNLKMLVKKVLAKQ